MGKNKKIINLNQIQRTSNHNSPVEKDKNIKINNSHFYTSTIAVDKNTRVRAQEI